VKEAEQNRSADEKRSELVKVKNEADSLAYQVEKSLSDLGDKVNATDRGTLERQIADVREAAKTDDVNRIRQAMEALQGAAHTLAQQAYAQQNAQPGGSGFEDFGANGNGSGSNGRQEPDDVIEGQFTEI
jgi:molecular chaperone DnaK